MSATYWLVSAPAAALLLALAVPAAITAARGRGGKLHRSGRLGVRSRAALASEAAFAAANRVAAPLVTAVAVIAGAAALLLLAGRLAGGTSALVFVIAGVGAVVLLVQSARLGDQAARAVPVPARRPGGGNCGGCACEGGGCSVLSRSSVPGSAAGSSAG